MAGPKKINTRIINKHATAAVWYASTFKPLQGEVVIYDPGVDPKDGVTYDFERMKIGDGTNFINDLPFVAKEPRAGTGLLLSDDNVINHINTVTPKTASGSNGTVDYGESINIPSVTYDAQGHITSTGITTITLPAAITAEDLKLTGAMKFVGITTTNILDGSSSAIELNGKTVQFTDTDAGSVVLYRDINNDIITTEFVWTGDSWEELGDERSFSLKNHTHSVSYTPSGTVSAPTITVTPDTTSVNSITDAGELPSLTYSDVETTKIDNWFAGALPSASLSEGSVCLTESISDGPNRIITLTQSYSNPILTFSSGELPSLTHTLVKSNNITAWSAGSLPTKGSDITVVTSIQSAVATSPVFTGTPTTIDTSEENS